MKNKKWLIVLSFLFLFITLKTTYSMVITPPYTNINYVPGERVNWSFNVGGYHEENSTLNLVVYPNGEFNQTTVIESQQPIPLKIREWLPVSGYLDLPSDLKPGIHRTGVIIQQEIPKNQSQGIFAVLGVEYVIYVIVPFPGKYLDSSLEIQNANAGKPIIFTATLTNLGSQTIKNTDILLTIYDKENKTIGNFSDNQKDIKQYDKIQKIFEWPTGTNPFGFYTVLMNLTYDSIQDSKLAKFRIGDILININNITGDIIEKGKIGKVVIQSESQYNDDISNVYAQIEFNNKIWKSSTVNFVSFGLNDLEIFLDTTDIPIGVYDAKAKIIYADKVTEKDFKLTVTVKKSFLQNKIFLSSILIIILIILAIVIYRLIKKKNTQKDNKK
jgi:hypothetical protein